MTAKTAPIAMNAMGIILKNIKPISAASRYGLSTWSTTEPNTMNTNAAPNAASAEYKYSCLFIKIPPERIRH